MFYSQSRCGFQGEYSVVQFGLVLLVGAYVYVSERFARHNFAWDDRISSARGADRDILKGKLGDKHVGPTGTVSIKRFMAYLENL